MNKTLSLVILALGIVLIIGGLALIFVIVPSQRVFPDDVDVVREFDVEYLTLLDPQTLEYFTAAEGEADDVKLRRHVQVEDATDDAILIFEEQTILHEDDVLHRVTYSYALDRTTLEPLDDPPDAWANREGLWARSGLVIGWGVDGVEQRDYVGWNEDTRETVTLEFQGEDAVNGMRAYRFTSSSDLQPIHADQVGVLGMLPELTIDQIAQLARGMEVNDPAVRTLLQVALPGLMEAAIRTTQDIPDDQAAVMVPIDFYYEYDGQYWVEPETGVLLNTVKYEHRVATFPQPIIDHLSQSVENLGMDPAIVTDLLPVTVAEYQYTGSEAAMAAARADAQDALNRLNLYGKMLPLILVVVGAALVLGGIVTARTRYKKIDHRP